MLSGTFVAQLPHRHRWLRWAVLVFGAAISVGGAWLYQREVARAAHAKFEGIAIEKAHELEARIRAYGEVLYALRGMFDASTTVTRDDFHQFAEALAVRDRYPGLTNLSHAAAIPHAQRAAFERRVREESSPLLEGMSEFAIKPPGARASYVVLDYIEPLANNEAAWGFDLLTDAPRRSVVERARDSGAVTSTSGVTLFRDRSLGTTSTLLRLAIYRGGGVPTFPSERERQFLGVVGATLRIGEVVEATSMRSSLAPLHLRIYASGGADAQGNMTSTQHLMYDSHPANGAATAHFTGYSVSRELPVGDLQWRVEIAPLTDPVDPLSDAITAATLLGSLTLTVVLFWLMSALAVVQRRRIELDKRNREMALIAALGDDLHACNTLQEAYAVVARQMPRLLPGTAAVLYELDDARSLAKAVVTWCAPRAAAPAFAAHDCQSLRRNLAHHAIDAAPPGCRHFTADPPASCLCVPLSAQGDVTGMLHLQACPDPAQPTPFDDAGLNLVRASAQHLSLALANIKLRESLLERATRDGLTGLYNRQYMLEWFAQEVHRAGRQSEPIGVIMLDIDHFKQINDEFGHDAGDTVLRQVAAAIRRVARRSDVTCRHGGEEFMVLMPGASPEATLGKAMELLDELRGLRPVYEGKPLHGLTASAGIATFPVDGRTPDALLRCADVALYAAKAGGRDRAVVSGARAPEPVAA